MQKYTFLALLCIAGGFVWFTSSDLPDVVASHFGSGGAANGFSSKGSYTALMLALVVGMPGLMASMAIWIRALPRKAINLPNKDYWLAPERSAATREALASLCRWFALALAAFLCVVHWLVVQANAMQPPRLAESAFYASLAAFAAVNVAWILFLFRRFGRVP